MITATTKHIKIKLRHIPTIAPAGKPSSESALDVSEQFVPVKPEVQLHWYDVPDTEHAPEFLQGSGKHGSSRLQLSPIQPMAQVQTYADELIIEHTPVFLHGEDQQRSTVMDAVYINREVKLSFSDSLSISY